MCMTAEMKDYQKDKQKLGTELNKKRKGKRMTAGWEPPPRIEGRLAIIDFALVAISLLAASSPHYYFSSTVNKAIEPKQKGALQSWYNLKQLFSNSGGILGYFFFKHSRLITNMHGGSRSTMENNPNMEMWCRMTQSV